MKWLLLLVCCSASALAQVPRAVWPTACGSENADFHVKLSDAQHAPSQPAPGMAIVYFIHEAGNSFTFGYPTSKIGIDGAWAGANHGNSWFSVSVAPGEHHLCAALQSSLLGQRVELVHLTAEAGKIYFCRTRLVMSRSVELSEFQLLDSDQGNYLLASFQLAISTPKK